MSSAIVPELPIGGFSFENYQRFELLIQIFNKLKK
jgi:hypothetical protein